ncbi:N/A [soil metagenome]
MKPRGERPPPRSYAGDPRPWADARRILAVRLDTLGDVLMTTPAFRALKESGPGRHLTLLTSPSGAGAARLIPEVDDVVVYRAPWMPVTPGPSGREADLRMVDRLRRGRFDAAVVFTVYSQNPLPAALLCSLAGIPLKLAHSRERPYALLSDWVPEEEPERFVRHEVRRQLDLVATVGARTSNERLSLAVPEAASRRVEELLDELGLGGSGERWVVMHPGAGAPSRRYPPEGFADVARRLVHEDGCRVLLTGSDAERELVEGLQGSVGPGAHPLPGRLDLGELAALIERSPLLIANNTGPVHVAAAVGTPVVVLYALTNPQHTPWEVPSRVLSHDVPCKFCYRSVCPEGHHNCLRLVSPESVLEAARDLLSSVAERQHSVR